MYCFRGPSSFHFVVLSLLRVSESFAISWQMEKKEGRKCVGDFYRLGLELEYIMAHNPLSRSPSHGPTQRQGGKYSLCLSICFLATVLAVWTGTCMSSLCYNSGQLVKPARLVFSCRQLPISGPFASLYILSSLPPEPSRCPVICPSSETALRKEVMALLKSQ